MTQTPKVEKRCFTMLGGDQHMNKTVNADYVEALETALKSAKKTIDSWDEFEGPDEVYLKKYQDALAKVDLNG